MHGMRAKIIVRGNVFCSLAKMGRMSSRQLWTAKISHQQTINIPRKKKTPCGYEKRGFDGVVLGIDPSLRGTGLAVVEFTHQVPKLVMSCRITCPPKLSFFECIHEIFLKTSSIVSSFDIGTAAIEQTIYVQNYKTSHILGAAKGASIAAIMQKNIEIAEYAPLRIKQSVTGIGKASKEQVLRTIRSMLSISDDISYDESDAIAVACCHAWTSRMQGK